LGERLGAEELTALYDRASDLLARSQHPGTLVRLSVAARFVFRRLAASRATAAEEGMPFSGGHAAVRPRPAADYRQDFDWEGFSLREESRRFERTLIESAQRGSGGAATRASRLLGFEHYQSFIALLNSRHQDLLAARTPAVPRRRGIIRRQGARETPRQGRGLTGPKRCGGWTTAHYDLLLTGKG
jgi:hypothetical protein